MVSSIQIICLPILWIIGFTIGFPFAYNSYMEAQNGVEPGYVNITNDLSSMKLFDYGDRAMYSVHLRFDPFEGVNVTQKVSIDTYPHIVVNITGCYITFKPDQERVNGLYDFPATNHVRVRRRRWREIPNKLGNGDLELDLFTECMLLINNRVFKKTQVIHTENQLNSIIDKNFCGRKSVFIGVAVCFGLGMLLLLIVIIAMIYAYIKM